MSTELNYAGLAFGTEYNISLVGSDLTEIGFFADFATEKIQHFEQAFSRFLPTSELSELNRNKKLAVCQDFIDITLKAQALYRKTDTNFNPLLQISKLGYTSSFDELEKNQLPNIKDLNYDLDFSKVIIDEKNNTIELAVSQELDFGGLLKGYLAEKICGEIIKQSTKISGVIINLGGDLATAGLDANNQSFKFNIVNPVTKINLENIPLSNQALATSGIDKRVWKQGEKTVSHIMVKSGKNNPENDLVVISIIHDHGAEAEAFTKVFFNLGVTKANELLSKENYYYFAINVDGTISTNFPSL